jgi:hypothetical protein
MQSFAAYVIAQALIREPEFYHRRPSRPGIAARVRALVGRPAPAPNRGEAWFDVPPLVDYPTSR